MFRPFKKRSRSGIALVFALFGFPFSAQAANDCPAILPADAAALSQSYLCRVASGSNTVEAVCREYSSNTSLFTVVFRGGATPLAILGRNASGTETSRQEFRSQRCDLERPAGVPSAAAFRGTGVCQDESGQSLPCSVYEHAAAREPVAKRYFAYYEPDGRGLRKVEVLPAGRNARALEAELAFQLGHALTGSSCCREEARGYLAHAASLFPREPAYQTAYQEILSPKPAAALAESSVDCGAGSGAILSSSF